MIPIIGCKIDSADAHVTVRKRGCSHQESSAPFCGQCGKTTWTVSQELSPVLKGLEEDPEVGSIGVFYNNIINDEYYAGIRLAHVDYDTSVNIDIEKFKKDYEGIFKRILKRLYKPENFGVWLVLDAG
jgi:hypothetical protein